MKATKNGEKECANMTNSVSFLTNAQIKALYKAGLTKTIDGVLWLDGMKLFDKTKSDYAKEYYYSTRGFR